MVTLILLDSFQILRRRKYLLGTENPHPNSAAGYLALKAHLQSQDEDLQRRHCHPRKWNQFRRHQLQTVQETQGQLECCYCKRTHLVIDTKAKNVPYYQKATIDHIFPLSKGGARFDLQNLAVACMKCNHQKSNQLPEEFQKTPAPIPTLHSLLMAA